MHHSVLAYAHGTVIVAESGTTAIASMSGFLTHNAVLIASPSIWASVPFPTPGAKWVWYSAAAAPKEVVTIKHDFKIQCPNQPLTLSINVDNFFTFDVNGAVNGSGNDWTKTYNFTIGTQGVACGTADLN